MTQNLNTRILSRAGILTGIAVVLMITLKFPIPFMPPFLNVDLSSIPILILAFSLGSKGIVAGLLSILAKDLIHLFVTTTGGVGELADFLCSAALILPASLIYSRRRTKKGAAAGLAVGIISMTAMGAFANKFILLPFYGKIMPMDEIFAACAQINPVIIDEASYILYGAVPFNVIKGIILSAITVLIYKKISVFMNK